MSASQGGAASFVHLPSAFYASPGFHVANASAAPWPRLQEATWEPYTFELLDRLLLHREDAVFVDVGAFVGPLSLYAASLNATVYAAEGASEEKGSRTCPGSHVQPM